MSDAAAVPDHDGPPPEPAGGDGGYPSIIIQGSAMARIEAEMGADTGAEIGGVLVGNAAPSTNFVLVTGSLPAPRLIVEASAVAVAPIESEGEPNGEMAGESAGDMAGDMAGDRTGPAAPAAPAAAPAFTFSSAVLEDLAREVAAAYPGQRIVGWYHSHPRSGIFLSAHDLYVQSAFFAQSWQIGYVYDPVQAQRGFFGWSGREVVRVPQWEITSLAHASGAALPVNAPAVSGATVSDAVAAAGISAAHGRISIGEPTPYGAPATSDSGPSKKKRPIGAIVAAAAVVVAIVIGAIALNSGDDEASTSTTNASDSTAVNSEQTDPVSDPTGETVTPASDPATTVAESTTTAASGDVTTTEPAPITFPATPTAVAAPAGRVGDGATACAAEADGSYAPLADCFVPLNNGNVLVFVSGSLRCVDPSGVVVANEAQTFTLGAAGDPVVLVADDALNPTCNDLTYAKNVLTGGSDTFDGLCGSSGTQINDGTRRCFAQNTTNGAIVALVRSATDQGNLVASCKTDGAEAALAEVDWSNNGVGTSWRVDSVIYQSASNDFLATASRTGSTATATISCG